MEKLVEDTKQASQARVKDIGTWHALIDRWTEMLRVIQTPITIKSNSESTVKTVDDDGFQKKWNVLYKT